MVYGLQERRVVRGEGRRRLASFVCAVFRLFGFVLDSINHRDHIHGPQPESLTLTRSPCLIVPPCSMAGVMTLVQMSRSLSDF